MKVKSRALKDVMMKGPKGTVKTAKSTVKPSKKKVSKKKI